VASANDTPDAQFSKPRIAVRRQHLYHNYTLDQ
jgi:hypothetical protein